MRNTKKKPKPPKTVDTNNYPPIETLIAGGSLLKNIGFDIVEKDEQYLVEINQGK